MKRYIEFSLLVLFISAATGCANPLHQATSIDYGDQCRKAEIAGRLDIAEQACYRALVNVDWGNLGEEQKSMRMYNLARIKRKLGKYDEAERLLKDSLAIEEKQAEPSNERIGRRLAELAILYGQKEQYLKGLPYVEKLYSFADIYKGNERETIALIFFAYSAEIKKKTTKRNG
ncbi:MAG: tetratricopeptide repeat protein [Syntrophaceae bacterium]